MNQQHFLALPFALTLLSLSSQVAAKTWDVPSEISTIQAAIDTSADGDTIAVAAGTYQERLRISGKGVVLIGLAGASNTILSGLGLPYDGTALLEFLFPPDTTVIVGFTFEDADGVYGGAIYCEGHRLILSENVFRRNLAGVGGAVLMWPGHLICTDNLFEENTAWDGGGAIMILGSATAEITRNVFQGNAAVGTNPIGSGGAISVDFGAGDSTLISENLIFDNEAGYGAINVSARSGYTILDHNTIVLNRSWRIEPHRAAGIRVSRSSALLRNNIVALNHNGWGITISHGADVTLECNDFWQNGLGDYLIHFTGGTFIGTTDFSANPLICDPASGDLTLAEGSPCLPENTGGCGLVGALGVGCSQTVGIEETNTQPSLLRVRAIWIPGGIKLQLEGEAVEGARNATVQIFDVQGRVVQTGVVQEAQYTWQGTNSSGQRVVRGVYFARVKVKTEVATTSFVLLP